MPGWQTWKPGARAGDCTLLSLGDSLRSAVQIGWSLLNRDFAPVASGEKKNNPHPDPPESPRWIERAQDFENVRFCDHEMFTEMPHFLVNANTKQMSRQCSGVMDGACQEKSKSLIQNPPAARKTQIKYLPPPPN